MPCSSCVDICCIWLYPPICPPPPPLPRGHCDSLAALRGLGCRHTLDIGRWLPGAVEGTILTLFSPALGSIVYSSSSHSLVMSSRRRQTLTRYDLLRYSYRYAAGGAAFLPAPPAAAAAAAGPAGALPAPPAPPFPAAAAASFACAASALSTAAHSASGRRPASRMTTGVAGFMLMAKEEEILTMASRPVSTRPNTTCRPSAAGAEKKAQPVGKGSKNSHAGAMQSK